MGFGRFISQPGNGALIIDLDYETGSKSWGCYYDHEVDAIDKLNNHRFIGMPNSSELLLELDYEDKEDSFADGPRETARRQYQYLLKKRETLPWRAFGFGHIDEWHKEGRNLDKWYKDFVGLPLTDNRPDCVADNKDGDHDNTKSATKAIEHVPFSYPSLEDIDDDDDGTAHLRASNANP